MKSILIVEDEKMIRLGIKAMVSRATVPVEHIYDCKNGEEALDILKKEYIEVMLTDIRMPKMDGLQLIEEAQKLPHVPEIVILSGYDDFNYAVQVMRCGVREYLLKPIERTKMNELLEKLDRELEQKKHRQYYDMQAGIQQLKYMLLTPEITEQEITVLRYQYGERLEAGYVVGCTNELMQGSDSSGDSYLILHDVSGQDVFLYYGDDLDGFCAQNLKGRYYGTSKRYTGVEQLGEAYRQARYAREDAFVRGISHCLYSDAEIDYEPISGENIEKFVQLCGSTRQEEAFAIFEKLLARAKKGYIEPHALLEAIEDSLRRLVKTYQNITMDEEHSIRNFFHILRYDTIAEYWADWKEWLAGMNEMIQKEYDDYKSKEKINQAIRYIQENYAKDLNMAVVSNYISMNYSLFSLTFKQYTGVNFVNYLKEIRINEAKRLLRETDDRIIDISHNVGYDNEKHFMKTFKALCGVSPSEYRKNNRIGRI